MSELRMSSLFFTQLHQTIVSVLPSKLVLPVFALLLLSSGVQAVPSSNFLADAEIAIGDRSDDGDVTTLERNALRDALKFFRAPSRSIRGDCRVFLKVTKRLAPVFDKPGELLVRDALDRARDAFVLECADQHEDVLSRLDYITPFQPLRGVATNKLAQVALRLNDAAGNTNLVSAVTLLNHAYLEVEQAARLTSKAERRLGNAPNSITGKKVYFTIAGSGGTFSIHFYADAEAGMQTSPTSLMVLEYRYERTGLNTATLILEGSPETETLLRFATSQRGRYSMQDTLTETRQEAGTFRLSEP
jgi:hypothetical protein